MKKGRTASSTQGQTRRLRGLGEGRSGGSAARKGAGASAGGLARWYMSAAVLLGAVSWRWAVQPAVHRAAAALAELACRPLRLVRKMLVRPAQMRLQAAQSRRRACRKAKKSAKIKKSAEKRLQKPSKVLYN